MDGISSHVTSIWMTRVYIYHFKNISIITVKVVEYDIGKSNRYLLAST